MSTELDVEYLDLTFEYSGRPRPFYPKTYGSGSHATMHDFLALMDVC